MQYDLVICVEMTSLEYYVKNVKPTLEEFLKKPSKQTLAKLRAGFLNFNWTQLKIFNVQILLPLVIQLDNFCREDQEVSTGVINCIRIVISNLYLHEEKALSTIIVVVLKQIRDYNIAALRPNLSEEIKLASVQCITEALIRSTSDVLETFYTKESAMILGHVLLTLLEFIIQEKYKKLVIASIECLMTIFYVHDEADSEDVVLRSQVADVIFIFLPKVVTVLFKTTMADEKVGESIIAMSIKALGRIICLMFEETSDESIKNRYDKKAFEDLFTTATATVESEKRFKDEELFFKRRASQSELEQVLNRLQTNLRSTDWMKATSHKLRPVFEQTCNLRSHSAASVRKEYAYICCLLLERCVFNLKNNIIYILESVIAMSEEEDAIISQRCQAELTNLQQRQATVNTIFDENAEQLFDLHLTKLPRILHRCDDVEQYAELLFIKGFFKNLSANKLNLLFLLPKNMEIFLNCLLTALDLRITRDLLNEEYSLREITEKSNYRKCTTMDWRQFKYLSSSRCIELIYEICGILGKTALLNQTIFCYSLELLTQQHPAMNEIILLLTLMGTRKPDEMRKDRLPLVELLLEELLNDHHWHLALQPDYVYRLKVDKPTFWFIDKTPGLYESAVELRMQEYDSDDEDETAEVINGKDRVTIPDAQFNVLHTCIVLDAFAHCALFIGETFDRYTFRSLHRILLKLANSNTMVYKSANYAFISMQHALRFIQASHFIEASTDYITYHLNTILKRSPESSSAVDILTIVLQYSTRENIPHLDSIFQTILEECAKSHQGKNISSYLKVFNAFLQHMEKWQKDLLAEVNSNMAMQMDLTTETDEILAKWLNVLNKPRLIDDFNNATIDQNTSTESIKSTENEKVQTEVSPEIWKSNTSKVTLPQYVFLVKKLLNQATKFLGNSEKSHQILSLDCLITGVPLMADYENELLPIVHHIWKPLVEKFRQKDVIVLNRCFSLLHILGFHAKDFILKRSLNDIIPFLKKFLKETAAHSAMECLKAQTQEYKLQLKLLLDFPAFIQNLQIDGKHLYEISETVSLYLSQKQPQELQKCAMHFYNTLKHYNGPFMYTVVLKKAYIIEYKENVRKIITGMNM